MQWDLSTVRPWEYGKLDATAWTTATAMKQAFESGMYEYRSGKKKKKTIETSDSGRLARLRKRVGGK